jgi:hypothetical protein
MNLVQSQHSANSTVAIVTLFAIINYSWPIWPDQISEQSADKISVSYSG